MFSKDDPQVSPPSSRYRPKRSTLNTTAPLSMTLTNSYEDVPKRGSWGSTRRFAKTPSYHEPFATFQHKISELIYREFEQFLSKVKIEHMRGGSYNRVAAVTITPPPALLSLMRLPGNHDSSESEGFTYIVRVPRGTGAKELCINRDVAILETVGALLKLPIPRILAFDLTCNNPLGRPYMIQPRLPGQNLAHLWNTNTLNIEQLKSITRRVTELAEIIATVKGPGGNISLDALHATPTHLKVESLHLEHRVLGDRSFTLPEQPQSTFEHLIETCRRWSQYWTAMGRPFDEIWDNFALIIQYLKRDGWLEGPCVLAHRDLMAYNLLVEVRSEVHVEITGVIDWDSAAIAPEFVAYRAPFWIWTGWDVKTEICDEEITARLPPLTEKGKILKQVFLTTASEKYKFLAFSPEAIMARRMYYILKQGLRSDWHVNEAWAIIHDWKYRHPGEPMLPSPDYGADDQFF